MDKGLIYIFTGDGKGKTSAAIGIAVRAVGVGMKVGWVAFYKQASWNLSEMTILKQLGVQVFLCGKGFYIKKKVKNLTVTDTATEPEHKEAAKAALKKAGELVSKVDVLVMDEVNNALNDGLIQVGEVGEVVKGRGKTHVILTGRGADPEIVKLADLVTEMKKIKHPYDTGKLAIRGLDF